MTIQEIENKRKELMGLCKKHENCVGCPLDNEGCVALEILDKNPANFEAVFEYLERKEK